MTTTALPTITLNVKANGETRALLFRISFQDENGGGVAYSEELGVYSKGAGGKLWPERIRAFRDRTGEWKVAYNAVILNRNGYMLAGFADKVSGHRSAHNSANNG